MIRAMIFDLDGTLVQTEKLKALSYARAAVQLCPRDITEAEVIEMPSTLSLLVMTWSTVSPTQKSTCWWHASSAFPRKNVW